MGGLRRRLQRPAGGLGPHDPFHDQDGERDAILAVATKQRKYAFLASPAAVPNGSWQAVDDLRRNNVEPKLREDDFAGAAVAAATGLQGLG